MKCALIHDETGTLCEFVPYHEKDTKKTLADKYAQKMWGSNKSAAEKNRIGKERYLDFEKMHFDMYSKGVLVLTERSKRAIYAILDYDGYDRTAVALAAAKELAIHKIEWPA